jgi:hypothetical protein
MHISTQEILQESCACVFPGSKQAMPQGSRVTIDFISRNFGNRQLAEGRPLLGFSGRM